MILLPKDMTIEKIHEEGDQKIDGYYPHRMEQIIELIQRANFATYKKGRKKPAKEKPFVYSMDLNKISGNYKEYIEVLFHLELLIIDGRYSNRLLNPEIPPFPMSYYFTPICGEKLFRQNTVYRLSSILNNNNYEDYNTKYLDNSLVFNLNRFFAFLTFNPEDILQGLDKEFKQNTHLSILGSTKKDKSKRQIKKIKKSFLRYNRAVYSTFSLAQRHFNFFRNHTNHRLYGPLTNYPKRLRKYFTLKGSRITSVDLSNAQPFLSLLLFDPRFWQGEDCSDPLPLNIDTIGMKKCFTDGIYTYLRKNRFSSLEKYKNLVLNDQLYNHLITEYGLENGDPEKAKKKAKQSMYSIMFSKAKSDYAIKPESKRAKFMNTFPDIYAFWAEIKDPKNQIHPIKLNPNSDKLQEPHSLLSIMLQRMEAFLFLDIIVPYILNHHPNVPMIPIHDCLATTEGNEELVEGIIRKFILQHTGLNPHLKPENWF